LPSYLEAVQKVADYQLQNIQRLKSQWPMRMDSFNGC
jgi:hypothetical protein